MVRGPAAGRGRRRQQQLLINFAINAVSLQRRAADRGGNDGGRGGSQQEYQEGAHRVSYTPRTHGSSAALILADAGGAPPRPRRPRRRGGPRAAAAAAHWPSLARPLITCIASHGTAARGGTHTAGTHGGTRRVLSPGVRTAVAVDLLVRRHMFRPSRIHLLTQIDRSSSYDGPGSHIKCDPS
jgi:hypothetical protein